MIYLVESYIWSSWDTSAHWMHTSSQDHPVLLVPCWECIPHSLSTYRSSTFLAYDQQKHGQEDKYKESPGQARMPCFVDLVSWLGYAPSLLPSLPMTLIEKCRGSCRVIAVLKCREKHELMSSDRTYDRASESPLSQVLCTMFFIDLINTVFQYI